MQTKSFHSMIIFYVIKAFYILLGASVSNYMGKIEEMRKSKLQKHIIFMYVDLMF